MANLAAKIQVDQYLPLVREVARIRHCILIKASAKNIEIHELENVGYCGLVAARQKFDPQRGSKFESFARSFINNAISQFLRDQDPLDHRVRKQIKNMRTARIRLQQQLGHEPDENELARELSLTLEKLQALQAREVYLVSIEANAEDAAEDGRSALALVDSDPTGEQKAVERDIGRKVDDCMKDTLNKDEMLVFLLKDLRFFTLKDIARLFGSDYDQQKIFRTLVRAHEKMKRCLKTKDILITDLTMS